MVDGLFKTPRAAAPVAARGGGDGTHPCAAIPCRIVLPARILMCRTDWRRVPRDIQRQVWATYRRGQTAATASPEYLAAVQDAVDAVRQASR